MKEDYPETLQQVDRVYVLTRGRKLHYFGGCDYFRLSSHPSVLKAVRRGLERFGLSTAASRKTTGNHHVYHLLEEALASLFGSEEAVLASSGYLANLAAAQGLRGSVTRVLLDERAHRSLQESLQALNVPIATFKHRNAADLRRMFKAMKSCSTALVVTDGVFAHDGSVAPVKEYQEITGRNALLWIDDAHGAGVLGRHGAGTVEAAGLHRDRLIQTVTLSKAFGSYGGAVLCDRVLAKTIIEKSAVISGNTPIPLPLACGALAAVKLGRTDTFRRRLERNVTVFWNEYGIDPRRPLTPIISFGTSAPEAVSRSLLRAGIYPPLISYPGGPADAYFRFALSSQHPIAHVTKLAATLGAHAADLALLGGA